MSRPILIGALTGGALAIAIWPSAQDALARYDVARVAAAQDQAAAGIDRLPVATFRLVAGSAPRAQAIAAARLRNAARAGGVLIERLAPMPPLGPGIARVGLTISGSEKAVLTLADAMERGGRGMRLRGWKIEALPGGAVRLSGELAAAWR